VLSVGDRVKIDGGYDIDPSWLQGGGGYEGIIEDFLTRHDGRGMDALVRLAAPVTLKGVTGSLVLLSLRYESAKWEGRPTVHVVLCSELPREPDFLKDATRFAWVESHASLRKL
jgi:hypothetical protein